MRTGGYQILDFENKNLTTGSKTPMESFDMDLFRSCQTKKRIVISGLQLNGKSFNDYGCYVTKVDDNTYTFTSDGLMITITATEVSVAAASRQAQAQAQKV